MGIENRNDEIDQEYGIGRRFQPRVRLNLLARRPKAFADGFGVGGEIVLDRTPLTMRRSKRTLTSSRCPGVEKSAAFMES
jgi:hypothetical protein